MTASAVQELEQWLVDWLVARGGGCPADPTATFASYGLTSADAVGLAGELEEYLGRSLEPTLAYDHPTPRALASALAGDEAGPGQDSPPRPRTRGGRGAGREEVAVVGLAGRFPGGADTPERYWSLLTSGLDAISEVPADRWDVAAHYHPDRSLPGKAYTKTGAFLRDVAGWDAGFFGLSPQEALRLDPQHRLLMEVVWEALEDAAISPDRLRGSRTGLVAGLMGSDQYARVQFDAEGDRCAADPYFGLGTSPSAAAGRVAHFLDLRGPCLTVDTACSSGALSVHLAAQSLLRGDCDLALAGASSANLHPIGFVQACAMGMLAADGRCKVFDADADGFAMGEGAGALVLARLSDATALGYRVRAVLAGSATNQDGYSNGLTAPNRQAQVQVIRQALAAAGVSADDIAYVEAHGSGTALGDAIEYGALRQVFGPRPPGRPLLVGAAKSVVGHLLAAAGIAGLIKAVLVLENALVPANAHLRRLNPAVDPGSGVLPAGEPQSLPARAGGPLLAGVSSFGWSGTNVHLVLRGAGRAAPSGAGGRPMAGAATSACPGLRPEPPKRPAGLGHSEPVGDYGMAPGADAEETARVRLLPLSAHDQPALAAMAQDLGEYLETRPATRLADVAHTLQIGRAALRVRRAVVGAGIAGIRRGLGAVARGEDPGVSNGLMSRPRIGLLLPGIGDLRPGLGRELYETEAVFGERVDECARLLLAEHGLAVRPALGLVGEVPAAAPGRDGTSDLAGLLGRSGPPGEGGGALERAEVAHPAAFTLQYALAALLDHWGIRPELMLGYSLGEYTAACLAGVFTLPDALRVIVGRAKLIAKAPPGAMLAVAAAPADLPRVALSEVDIAAINGPAMTVLSGAPEAIERAARELTRDSLPHRRLATAHPFHSALLEPARSQLAALVASVPRRAPHGRLVSNVTGLELPPERATDPEYWAEHLCRPVRFADGLRTVATTATVLLEVGPGTTLTGLARQDPAMPPALPTMRAWGDDRPDREVLLHAVGRLWEEGVEPDWTAIDCGGRRISLPSYPFQRTRYWPEPAEPSGGAANGAGVAALAGGNGHREDLRDWCHVPVWQQRTGRVGVRPQDPRCLVVFADAGGVGEAAAIRARRDGHQVTVVHAEIGLDLPRRTRHGRVWIDPAQGEQYRALFADLARQLADGGGGTAAGAPARQVQVVHAWSLDAVPPGSPGSGDDTPEADPVAAAVAAAATSGFHSLRLLGHALHQAMPTRSVDLLAVVRGTADVGAAPRTAAPAAAPAPLGAMVVGLMRTLPEEYSSVRGRCLDLGPAVDLAADAAALTEELDLLAAERRPPAGLGGGPASSPARPPGTGTGLDAVVARAAGRRWQRGWERVPLAPVPWRRAWGEGGVYLITGGTGGLGLFLARSLAREISAQVVVVGRAKLPGRPEWDSYLAGHPGNADRAARLINEIRRLEASGARVVPYTADVNDAGQVRAAVAAARELGVVRGAIHAAGVPGGGLLHMTTREQADAVIAPKVTGTLNLVRALAELPEPPEQLVLYSSAVNVLGGLGESAYAAGNAFLDACAEVGLAAQLPSTRVVSVAWGAWRHDTWQSAALAGAGELRRRVREYRDSYGIGDDEGPDVLTRIVDSGIGRALVLPQRIDVAVRQRERLRSPDLLLGDGARLRAPRARFPRPALRTDFVAPRTETEQRVAEVWQEHLGIDRVGVHDAFFELGGGSLVGVAVMARIVTDFGVELPPAALFDRPTVAELAELLEGGASPAEAPTDPGGGVLGAAPANPGGAAAARARGLQRRYSSSRAIRSHDNEQG